MFDVFVSYAREDRDRVKVLTDVLELSGKSVFWDPQIAPGHTWRDAIGTALGEAQCVVVIWSQASIASSWVLQEADEGLRRGLLVPVLFDTVEPPLGLRHVQAADLVGWDGSQTAKGFVQLLAAIDETLSRQSQAHPPSTEHIDESAMESGRGSQREVGPPDADSETASKSRTLRPDRRAAQRLRLTAWWPFVIGGIVLMLVGVISWFAQETFDEQPDTEAEPRLEIGQKVLAAWRGTPCLYPGNVQKIEGDRYEVYYRFGGHDWVDHNDIVVARAPHLSELGVGILVYAPADTRDNVWLRGVIRERRVDLFHVQFTDSDPCRPESPHAWVVSTDLLVGKPGK